MPLVGPSGGLCMLSVGPLKTHRQHWGLDNKAPTGYIFDNIELDLCQS